MPVTKQLTEVGRGVWAYMQLPGSWGWSNAGLVTDGDESLLVDTLFDEKLTAEMLETFRKTTRAADPIGTVVNTHGNGDHCYGNGLVAEAEIVATTGCVVDLVEAPPRRNAQLMAAARFVDRMGAPSRGLARMLRAVGLPQLEWLTDATPFARALFDDFDFPRTGPVLPTRTFEGTYEMRVGDKRVEIVEVGPAHTRGDAYVHVPDDRVVFTGDLLFQDAHPIVWRGPVANWIRACQKLLDLDIETVVPGHGPVTDKSGLRNTIAYFELLTAEARRRYDAGMTVDEAVRDIALDAYRGWIDPERVYVNVRTLYRDFEGDREEPHILELFAKMARFRERRL